MKIFKSDKVYLNDKRNVVVEFNNNTIEFDVSGKVSDYIAEELNRDTVTIVEKDEKYLVIDSRTINSSARRYECDPEDVLNCIDFRDDIIILNTYLNPEIGYILSCNVIDDQIG